MRRILISASALVLLIGSISCENEESNELLVGQVPKAVQESFKGQYPDIDCRLAIKWKSF